MKKPKLNKVEPSTIYRKCDWIQMYTPEHEYKKEVQDLIDLFIPEGWRLDFDDIDRDTFDDRTKRIIRAFSAVYELNSCYVSCSSLRVTETIKRIVVRDFTEWLSKQFDQFGEEVE